MKYFAQRPFFMRQVPNKSALPYNSDFPGYTSPVTLTSKSSTHSSSTLLTPTALLVEAAATEAMLASDSIEQQHEHPDHAIQLKFTTDDPDNPIARKITYNALPVWRHLLKKVEKLFNISSESIQIIYTLNDGNEIIVNSDHDLRAVLTSTSASDHIVKFVVRNMHSPKTPSKIIGRPTHNRPPSPQKFYRDFMRALDTEIPHIKEPPPNILNYKPRKYRLFTNGDLHDEDYLRKTAAQYNSVPLAVPLHTPRMIGHIEWPKEVPDRIPSVAVLPPPALAGPRLSGFTQMTSPPTVKPVQPIKPIPSPPDDPVEGLSLDLGPPADPNAPSALGIHLNGLDERHSSSPAVRPAFNSPVPVRNFTGNRPTTIFSSLAVPSVIPPPQPSASAPVFVPAPISSASPVPPRATSQVNETETTHSLGLGLNLPLGTMIPIPNASSASPRGPDNSNNSSSDSIVSRGPTIPPSSPPGIIPIPQPHPSPVGAVIDDTSEMQKPSMLLSPLLLPGEATEPQNKNAKRVRRRPGEIIVIEETSVSSSSSVQGHVGGLENILRNGYGSTSASETRLSPPLGSAAVHQYNIGSINESDSTERSQPQPVSKMKTETPPIMSSSHSRPRKSPETFPTASPSRTSRRSKKTSNDALPKKTPFSSSESPLFPPNKITLSGKKKKRFTPSPSQLKRPTAPVASILSLASKVSKSSKLPLAYQQAPVPVSHETSFSSTSTKRPMISPGNHTVLSAPPPAAEPIVTTPLDNSSSLVSEPVLLALKSELGDMVKSEIKEGIERAVEELKTELKRSLAEILQTHRNELREHLEQTDRQPSERSRGFSRERPSYTASVTAQPPPPPPFTTHSHSHSHSIPPSVPPLHSYHPYMSLPTSTIIFPPHHPYCGDYTLPTPSFSMPYRSYAIPPTTYACCHGHAVMKPPEPSLSLGHHSSHPHAAPGPPPPPPIPPPPPPPPAQPLHAPFQRQARWPHLDNISAAPAYSETSLPRPGNTTNGTRSEYDDIITKVRGMEEMIRAMKANKDDDGLQQLRAKLNGHQDSTESAPTLASSSNANPQLARKQSSSESSTYSVGEYYLIQC